MSTENQDEKTEVLSSEHTKDGERTSADQEQIESQLRIEVQQTEDSVQALESQITSDIAALDALAANPESSNVTAYDIAQARAELERISSSARGMLQAFLDSIPDVFYRQPVEAVKKYRSDLEEKALAVPDNGKVIATIGTQLRQIGKERHKNLKQANLERGNLDFQSDVLSYYHVLNPAQKAIGAAIFTDSVVAILEKITGLREKAAVKDEKKWEAVDQRLDGLLKKKIALDASNGNLEDVLHWFTKMQHPTPDFAAEVARAVILSHNQGVKNVEPKYYDSVREDFVEIARPINEYYATISQVFQGVPILAAAFEHQKNNLYTRVLSQKESEIIQAFGEKIGLWSTLEPELKTRILEDSSAKSAEKWLAVLVHSKKGVFLGLLNLNPFRSKTNVLSAFSDAEIVTQFLDSLPADCAQSLQEIPSGMLYFGPNLEDVPLLLGPETKPTVISRAQKISKIMSHQYGRFEDIYTSLLFNDDILDKAVSEIDNQEILFEGYETALTTWRESTQLAKKQDELLVQQNAVNSDPTLDFEEKYQRVAALEEGFQEYRSEALKRRPEKPTLTGVQNVKNIVDLLANPRTEATWSPDDAGKFLELFKNVPPNLLRIVLKSGKLPPGMVQCHEALRRDFGVPENEIKNLIQRLASSPGSVGPLDRFMCQALLEASAPASVPRYVWENHRVYNSPDTIAFIREHDEKGLVDAVVDSALRTPESALADLQKIENIFPFFEIVGKYRPDFVLQYFDRLPEGANRDMALKGLDISDLQKKDSNILKIAAASQTSTALPWRAALEKLRRVQDFSARAEHCPWVKELKPLTYGQLAKGNLDFTKSADGELLLEYVKEFGAFNLPTVFDIFAEIKRGKTLAQIWESEPGKRARDFLGSRADKMKNTADLLNEVRSIKRSIQKEILEDTIPAGLSTELGSEIFNFLRGSTAWSRADGGIQTMSAVWQETATKHPEMARLPQGYQEIALAVAEVAVVDPSPDESAEKIIEKEKTEILNHKNVQEQWKRNFEPMAEINQPDSLVDWWYAKQATVVRELQQQMDNLIIKRGSLSEKAQFGADQSIMRINVFLEKWQKVNIKSDTINTSELQAVIEELAQLAGEVEKDKKLRAFVDESLYPLSVAHMEKVMPEGYVAYLKKIRELGTAPTEEGLVAYSRLMREYVAEHYLHVDQKPDHIGHAGFSKEALKKLMAIWQVGKKMESENALVKAGVRLEQLSNPNLESTGKTRDIAMVPVRGLMRVFAGDIGDACYTSQHDRLAKGEFPGLTAGIMVSNRGTAQERMEGSVLFIETQTAVGESALIVRANNPRMSLMEKVDPNDLIKKTLEYAITVAKARGIKRVVVPRDAASASCSNRQEVAKYYGEQYKGAPSVPLVQSPDTTFNGYQIWNGTCVEIWHSDDVAPTPKPPVAQAA